MKNIYPLLLAIFTFGNILGQTDKNNYDSKWFIGFNTGATWSSTDIDNSWKWRSNQIAEDNDKFRTTIPSGWGWVLGKSFNYDYGKILSFDIRGRYLHGFWYGQGSAQDSSITASNSVAQDLYNEYKDDYGGFIPNYQVDLRRLSLEFVLHLNRLKEKTGVDPYLFAGAGFSWKKTRGDLLSLETNAIYTEQQLLNNDLDFIYETELNSDEKRFMPSLGFGLAYQASKGISIGVEHKTTFTLGDQFDGYNTEVPRFKNDLYHYTSAFIRFRLGGSNNSSGSSSSSPSPTPTPSPIVNCPKPEVNILNAKNTTVTNSVLNISAQLKNVTSVSQIKLTDANQMPLPFDYDSFSNKLTATVNLVPGSNAFYIRATNNCGSNMERLNVQFSDCIMPSGNFTNPSTNNTTVDVSSYLVQAKLFEVTEGAMVKVYVNNYQVYGFGFNAITGILQSDILLNPGANNIRIDFDNYCGSGSINITVDFEQCEVPRIELISPSASGSTTKEENQNIHAAIFGTSIDKNKIKTRLNGTLLSASALSYVNGSLRFSLVLIPGLNQISIEVENECGSDTESFTIDLEDCDAPGINFNGIQTGITVTESALSISMGVTNITGAQSISYKLNGKPVSAIQFNSQTNTASGNLKLTPGDNYFTVNANNDCGSDIETLHIIFEECKTPSISISSLGSSSGGTNVSVTNPAYVFVAAVQNVDLSSAIVLTQNGQRINYSLVNGTISSHVTLGPGLNTFVLEIKTPCGRVNSNLTIVYDDCQPPIIEIKEPSGSMESTSEQIQLVAELTYASNNSQIILSQEGLIIPFAFKNGVLKAKVVLIDGENNVKLKVTNPCGEDTESITIEYLPCTIPEIILDNSSIPSFITTSTLSIAAAIFNYEPSTAITITLNGNTIPPSSYQVMNGTLTGSIPVNPGQNTISIYAVSPCGSDSKEFSVLRCETPSVNWTNPAIDNSVVTNESFTLEAIVNNALDASNIIFSFNGSPQSFDFDLSIEKLTKTVYLVPGNNVFAMRIQNTCGATYSSITVKYNPTIESPQNPNINKEKENGSNKGIETPTNKGKSGGKITPTAPKQPKSNNSTKEAGKKSTPKNVKSKGTTEPETEKGTTKELPEKKGSSTPITPVKNKENGKG